MFNYKPSSLRLISELRWLKYLNIELEHLLKQPVQLYLNSFSKH